MCGCYLCLCRLQNMYQWICFTQNIDVMHWWPLLEKTLWLSYLQVWSCDAEFLRCPWTQHSRSPRVMGSGGGGGSVSVVALIHGLHLCTPTAEWDASPEPSSWYQSGGFSFFFLSLFLFSCREPEQTWSRRSTVRHRSSSSSSGAARSGSLRPGPMNWLRCPGTSTPDTG